MCAECRQPARRLRRQRCDACFVCVDRDGELPDGVPCLVCGERRRLFLQRVTIVERPMVMCGNCSLVAQRARPRVMTVEYLRRMVSRERRVLPDRRVGGRPHPPERRKGRPRVTD
jgi:hypothetical protein